MTQPSPWGLAHSRYSVWFVMKSLVSKNYFTRQIILPLISALQDYLLVVKTFFSRTPSALGCREDLDSESSLPSMTLKGP